MKLLCPVIPRHALVKRHDVESLYCWLGDQRQSKALPTQYLDGVELYLDSAFKPCTRPEGGYVAEYEYLAPSAGGGQLLSQFRDTRLQTLEIEAGKYSSGNDGNSNGNGNISSRAGGISGNTRGGSGSFVQRQGQGHILAAEGVHFARPSACPPTDMCVPLGTGQSKGGVPMLVLSFENGDVLFLVASSKVKNINKYYFFFK